MNREEYQQVKQIFQSALDIAPDNLDDFLNEKCSDNTVIRREVEKLLNSYESGYLEQPAIEKVAELMVSKSNLSIGQEIGHYKIVKKIGAGGMGEVFLAEDIKLDRQVAIKILPAAFAEDAERMNRFVREAKTASALNHPNIITIYEIVETDGTHFIATEYIEGETLRSHLANQSASLKTQLEMAIQIASALDAAHHAGIIHRDIKPENVMIRPDGLVKILDFGIAKLAEMRNVNFGTRNEEAETLRQSTSPGMIIGTANYMSPEQARGEKVDGRSDIFSFGILLYEMLSGKRAFEGETALESISSILKDEPKPISQFLPEVPSEIERIVNKTLRKDREERYQTAKDLLIDLKDAKQSLELQNLMERSIVPNHDENKTQILKATTLDEINQTATNQTVASNSTKKYLAVGLLTLLLAVGGFFGYKYLSPTKQIESIAVMPFENKSGNADVEYLSDGMTETLINSLSQIPNLNVKARSTVFRYKGKEFDLKKIAAELNVQAILTGQVIQRGDQMTLNLELIDAKTENVLWGNKYERKASDLVSLQSEIARDVSSKLKSKLSSAEAAGVEKNYTANSEAYQLYLKGRYHLNKRQIPELEKAVVFFKQAIEKDPNYALAYSGLADTYSVIPSRGDFRPKEYMPQAKQAAQTALELDPNLAEAHTSLAQFIFYYEYDFAGAEKSYKRAIELNPNYAGAHQWYSLLLAQSGRHDEANREITKAIELDPFSFPINGVSYFQLIFAGRFDEALLQAKKRNELFPSEVEFHIFNSRVYDEQGKYDQAVEEYLLAAKAIKDFKLENIAKLKEAYEKGGWDGYGRMRQEIRLEELNTKQAKDPNGYVKALDYALAYAWGKDKDKTIEYLNKAYDERERNLTELKVNRAWDFVRDDPRFKELVKKVGIPE